MRSEQAIFDDLAAVCASSGYAHALAFLCFRDNLVKLGPTLKAKHLQELAGPSHLIRTELTTLVGLMVKTPIDYSLPTPAIIERYINTTDSLLVELHDAMSRTMIAHVFDSTTSAPPNNPFADGQVLREPIFYGGESAYTFQYRDFSVQKYKADNEWLVKHKHFSIEDAREVVTAICKLQSEKVAYTLDHFASLPPDQWTVLPGFFFSAEELSTHSGINIDLITPVLHAFALPAEERNSSFATLSDFNAAAAYPILRASPTDFVLLQQYCLLEALYESPFYWLSNDPAYQATAMGHRGQYSEAFSKECLARVFGSSHVFSNVEIRESKGKLLGEIDVLVLFGDRALVIQSKSKRLTLEARKGNDLRLKDDFQKGIQAAYDQGLQCAKALSGSYEFVSRDSGPIAVPNNIIEISILCVLADHYPALSFQARQFLVFEESELIAPPFVMDVFTLDVLSEMLRSPLRFLSYINRRTRYSDRLVAAHELTILAYHLKRNLWIQERYDLFALSDDISVDLDVAMMVRREGLQGKGTPDGILTRLNNTQVGRLIERIEHTPNPSTIALGFELLSINEDAIQAIGRGIDLITQVAHRDGKHHDFTIALGNGESGLTVHCNDYRPDLAERRLGEYCVRRKYAQKAPRWFGLCLRPGTADLRFGIYLKGEWKYDTSLEAAAKRMAKPVKSPKLWLTKHRSRKPGRNDPCPCGSGKKYKKCCLK